MDERESGKNNSMVVHLHGVSRQAGLVLPLSGTVHPTKGMVLQGTIFYAVLCLHTSESAGFKILLAIFQAYSINFQRIMYFHPGFSSCILNDVDFLIFITFGLIINW